MSQDVSTPAPDGDHAPEGPPGAPAGDPIAHDGWRSRRAIASSVAGLLVFVAATGLLLVSGHWTERPFFSAADWQGAVTTVGVILGVGWGLLSIDKWIEMKRGK